MAIPLSGRKDCAATISPTHQQPSDTFGNGQRACIGRQFALQEATLVLGMLLQRFEFIDYADYQLKVKEMLTLKPHDFTIKVRARSDDERRTTNDERIDSSSNTLSGDEKRPSSLVLRPSSAKHATPLLVLYGSNLGTAEGIAQELPDDDCAAG